MGIWGFCKVLAGQTLPREDLLCFGGFQDRSPALLTNLTSITTRTMGPSYVNRLWARAEEKGGSAFRLYLLVMYLTVRIVYNSVTFN